MKDQRSKRTLRELRDLLNGEQNQTIVAIIDRDSEIGKLVAAARRAEPREAKTYVNMDAYTEAVIAYEPVLARAWAGYDRLLWMYVGAQIVELKSVFSPIAAHPNAAVRARFHKDFGVALDRATGKMEYLGKASPASEDPVIIRGKIPAAWQTLKEELRPLWEQLDRQGGLKPSEALKDKPSLVGHLEKLDAIGSVEQLARMSQEQLAKRLGDAGLAEEVYRALLPKTKRDEYDREKHASVPATALGAASATLPPPEHVEPAFVMPTTVQAIIDAMDPFAKPSPNGATALVWAPCDKMDSDGMRASKWATLTDAQLKKAPELVRVLVRATFERPMTASDRKRVESAMSDSMKPKRKIGKSDD